MKIKYSIKPEDEKPKTLASVKKYLESIGWQYNQKNPNPCSYMLEAYEVLLLERRGKIDIKICLSEVRLARGPNKQVLLTESWSKIKQLLDDCKNH